MKLEEKIKTIRSPLIKDTIGLLQSGNSDTIADFFDTFIKPKLPKQEIVKKWHKLLLDYIKDDANIGCAIRYGNSDSKAKSLCGETGREKLRRGWLTTNTEDGFNYFYADNYLSSFVYKMAIDEFVPSLDEFKEMFNQHKFPYGFPFHHDKQFESVYVTLPTADQPGFMGNYKVSHVFDSGRNYLVNGKKYKTIKELSEKFFDIGSRQQWNNKNKVRRIVISKDDKNVIIAHFLRFVHPLNYFLTPLVKKHTCICADIGEYGLMISYVKQYLQKTYGSLYQEFLDSIMWFDDGYLPIATGQEIIDIIYGPNIGSKKPNNSVSKIKKSSLIAVNLNPQNPSTFKAELLKKKAAKITWTYKNGSVVEEVWNASNFSESSNLLGNIYSKTRWRNKDKDGLDKVEITVL